MFVSGRSRNYAYHEFFNTRKDADPDLPQLAQAKGEFSDGYVTRTYCLLRA
jgi:hypothetical protein